MSTKETIKNKIENGYELDLGEIIDKSFITFKKVIWTAGFGYLFILSLLFITAFFLVNHYVSPEELQAFKKLTEDPNFLKNNPDYLLYYTIAVTILGIILAPFNAGFLKICHLANSEKKFTVLNLFDFYRGKHFFNIILGSLTVASISLGISLGLEELNLNLVNFILQLSISLFSVLFIPLIIFQNQNFLTAIITSSKLVIKSPFTILGAIIIGIIFAILGIIALCIGVVFTISYIYCIHYTIYENIIGFEEEKTNII